MRTNIALEQALQKASRRLREKMIYSVNLLQKAESLALAYGGGNFGYYLAFSAGKDSQALYHIAELAGVKFDAHMNLTSVDPPEVIRFVKQAYPEVDLIKPKKSIYQHAIEKQILPTMRVRWCCAEYKENSGAGRVTLIGIRHQESSRRAKRNEVEISNRKYSGTLEGLDEYRQELKAKRARRKSKKDGVNITNADQEQTLGCISGKESILISPIIHWTEQDVWEFLNKVMEVPHCSLYDEGWHRIGCIGCPMSSARQKQIENIRYPHVKRNWIKAIKSIRGGAKFLPGYIWWNIKADWMPIRNVRGLLRTQAVGLPIPTQNLGCRKVLRGGGAMDSTNRKNGLTKHQYIRETTLGQRSIPYTKMGGGNSQSNTRVNYGVWNERGFPKAHRLTA